MKNLKKLMSLLLALLMLAGNMTTALATDIVAAGVVHPSELIQTYAIDRSDNLTEFVKRVRIFDKDGKDVTDSSVLYDGVDYTFRVEFEENGTTLQYGVMQTAKCTTSCPQASPIRERGNSQRRMLTVGQSACLKSPDRKSRSLRGITIRRMKSFISSPKKKATSFLTTNIPTQRFGVSYTEQ